MPIDSLHPSYAHALPVWKLVRDTLGGEREIHEAGYEYLPGLSEQKVNEYAAYRKRAGFVGVTSRTHESLVGYLFRKDPQYIFPTPLADFMSDATLSGLSFYDWLKDTARDTLGIGRRGTLVDWDEIATRPYLAVYDAEQIINWKVERVGTMLALTKLVLKESSTKWYGIGEGDKPTDDYEHVFFEQWRVYDVLTDAGGNPFVRCQLWRKKKAAAASTNTGGNKAPGTKAKALPGTGAAGAGSDFILGPETYPARRGVSLGRIPFVFHGPNNHLSGVDKSPMEPIARVNVSHYRTNADLEHGAHFTGLPTPWAKCFGDTGDKLPLGATVAWHSENKDAECGFLEFEGTGLKTLVEILVSKEKLMANLGARMFDAATGRESEAYDTVRIRQTGETVTLSNVAIALTQSASKVLQWAAWWVSIAQAPEDLDKQAAVEMNTEFVQVSLTAPEITALVSAWQGNAISHETLFYRFQQGEMYPPELEYKDEVAFIQEPKVTMPGLDDGTGGGTGGDGTSSGGTGKKKKKKKGAGSKAKGDTGADDGAA